MKNSNLKVYLTLFFLVLVFVLPIIGGNLLYSYRSHLNFKTTNYGVIVNPALNVPFLYAWHGSEKKWRVIQVTDDFCDAKCNLEFYQLGQVKKALGKDTDRVVVLNIGGRYPQLQKLAALFIQRGATNFAVKNKIYLIDPMGNLFMYYPATTDPMNVLKDLQHVLGVSQIG